MITSVQIHDMQFERKLRGYDVVAVDDYLDQIAAYVDNLTRENRDLREKVKSTGDQLAYLKNLETTLRDTLVTAQRSAEETTRAASERADEILQTATAQAQDIIYAAQEEMALAHAQMDELKHIASSYRANFKLLMQAQYQILEDNPLGAEGEAEAEPRKRVLHDEPLTGKRTQTPAPDKGKNE